MRAKTVLSPSPEVGEEGSRSFDVDPYQSEFEALAEDKGGGWLVRFPDLPGCFGYGKSKLEALESANQSAQVWAEERLRRGLDIPPPNAHAEPSGNLRVRTPYVMHELLTALAHKEGTNLTALVNAELRNELDKVTEHGRSNNARAAGGEQPKTFSGEWAQRLPQKLHYALKVVSEEQGVSINALINVLLALAYGRAVGSGRVSPETYGGFPGMSVRF